MPQFMKLSPPPLSSNEVNSLVTRPGRDFVRTKIQTIAFLYSEENESGQAGETFYAARSEVGFH